MRGVSMSRVWRSSMLLEHSIRMCLQERSLVSFHIYHRNDNMDRAIKVLAQGVSPGVPKSYYALADHSYIPHSILHYCARKQPR